MSEFSDRELDAQIAEKVMGWLPIPDGMQHGRPQQVFRDPQGGDRTLDCGCVEDFNPSTDISAAMEVVEKMRELEYFPKLWAAQMWNVEFWTDEKFIASANEDSLPRAICQAALAAVTL